MKIKDIYEAAVKRGMELDPRGTEGVKEDLKRVRSEFDELKEKEKNGFDLERLKNPYSDTRILYGDPQREVKRVLAGIDIEAGEIVLADRLIERGSPIDLIISHHPEGSALATLYDVMGMQAPILVKYGLPVHIAEGLMDERIKEVERKLLPINHSRAVDCAKLLDIPFMCIHTPADNAVASFLEDLFKTKKPSYVSEVLEILNELPEYKEAKRETIGPNLVVGSEKRKAGRIFVDMTGGTGGSKKVYEGLSTAGIGTIVGMHISEDHRKEAKKHHINIIIAGHISSDNLGLNLLFDDILDRIEVVECSGFRRVKR